ncbi:hypothetical protein QJS04_geneDACA001894 [Acorus gramineus]|uniref:Uncharacterized protein n=1 Tax=Acorus gramineus TaxID=55184 RepID=A0AAV9BHH6_ACOGR|nr:hypothetical protein QJS04_geneDACA001894 [Acorus gramineus]
MDENDTEDFDWEAAVREIDSAFQQQHLPSSSTAPLNQDDLGRPITAISAPNRAKPVGGARQLKLDGFLERKTIPFEDGGFGGGDGGGHDGRVGVDIDMEAAKTWIYPGYDLTVCCSCVFVFVFVCLFFFCLVFLEFCWFKESG